MKIYFIRHKEHEADYVTLKDAKIFAQKVADSSGENVIISVIEVETKELLDLIFKNLDWGIPPNPAWEVKPGRKLT